MISDGTTNSAEDIPVKRTGFIALGSVDNKVSIYYEFTQPANSDPDSPPPVILLSNSLAASSALWEHFVETFSSQYAILTYDPRFHGRSPLPSPLPSYDYRQGHDISDLASDVIALLDALGIPRVYAAVGLSIGGAVVLAAGALFPSRIERVFVVGTKASASPGDDAAHDARIRRATEEGMSAMNEDSLARWFGRDWLTQNPDTAAFVRDTVLRGTTVEGFAASVAALRRLDLWGYADRIAQRVEGDKFVFVVGADDAPPVVADSKALAERAGSEFVAVRDAGHIVNIQQAREFEELVRTRLLSGSVRVKRRSSRLRNRVTRYSK